MQAKFSVLPQPGLAIAALFVSYFLNAQTTTGSFQGIVVGPDGSSVPEATITIRNTGTTQTRTTATNAQGEYTAPLLPPGVYDISAQAAGFQTVQKTGIQLQVNENARIDFTLQLSTVQELVTVRTEASLVDTQDAAVKQVVGAKEIVDLPLNGRSFRTLGLTAPGVADMAQNSNLATRGGGMDIVGSKDIQNNFLLDGFDNNDPTTGETMTFPTIDSLQEFAIEGANYGANVGFASGGIVTLVTRSGTLEFHGDLFEFLRNTDLDGRNFFALAPPPLHRNQFGGTLGGHFPKTKRVFFFGGYESTVDHEGVTQSGTVPTPQERNGDFSSLLPATKIIDPQTGLPFNGNLIPPSRINPIGYKIATMLIPAPSTGGLTANFVSAPSVPNDLQVSSLRTDFAQSENNTYFARWSQYWQTTTDTSTGAFPIVYNQLIKHNYDIGGEWTHVFGPRTVQEIRVGFGHVDNEKWPQNQQNWDQILGIPGPTLGLQSPNAISGGPPIINLTGYTSVSTNSNDFIRIHHLWQVAYQISHNMGKHSFRYGAEYRHYRMDITNDANPQGTFTFNGQYSKNAIADLLLGIPASTQNLIGPELNDELSWQLAGYVQDDWRMSRRLTLNLGLRWEYQAPDTSTGNVMGGFVPSLGKAVQVGTNGLPAGFRYNYYKNFAPRFGFAFDPTGSGKTSIRGGYGIYYESLTHNVFQPSGFTSYPISQLGVFTASTTMPNISLSDPFPAALAGSVFAASGYDPNYHGGKTQRWQFGVQRSVGSSGVMETDYVGSFTDGEAHSYNLNQPPPGPGALQPRRPYQGYSNITWTDASGEARYSALLAKYQQRLTSGLTFLGAYTLGQAKDNNGGTNQDPLNRRADWGRSNFDVLQRLVLSLIYTVPFKSYALKDWQLATITTLNTGPPATPIITLDQANNGASQRPNQNGNPDDGAPHTAQKWFNTSVYSLPAQYTYGDAIRNGITGPGTESVDLTLSRTFRYRERMALEFRVECFDTLNHPNFYLPIAQENSTLFGMITSAKDPREFQFGMKLHF
jgi:hypothetical protein